MPESKDRSSSSKKNNHPILVALIGAMAVISAALIGLNKIAESPHQPQEGAFSYCVEVKAWSDKGSQPIVDASVTLDIKSYHLTKPTDKYGCASFEIPNSLQNERGTINVMTAEKRTQTINQDIRGSSTTILFNPND